MSPVTKPASGPVHGSTAIGIRLAGSGVAGLLVALSLPPWPVSTGAWPLASVGLGLLFAVMHGSGPRNRLAYGLVAGFGLYLPGLWWMRDFSLPGYGLATVVQCLMLAAVMASVPARGQGRIVAFPAAVLLVEAFRGVWPFGGFPLAGIELGQASGPLVGVAALGGRLLLVGIVALAGAGIGSLGLAWWERRPSRSAPDGAAGHGPAVGSAGGVAPQGPSGPHGIGGSAGVLGDVGPARLGRHLRGALVALGLVVVAGVGGHLAPDGSADGSIRAAVVQGGGPRGLRAVDGDPQRVLDAHVAASLRVPPGVDLVLWPEDVVDLAGLLAGSGAEKTLGELAARLRTTLVAGVVEDIDDKRFRNASVVFGPDGRPGDRYDKVHLVPFGERIPWRGVVDRLADISAVPRDAIPGDGPGVLDTDFGRLGVVISYEVFFADRARAAIRGGGRVLLVPTNASSYVDSQVPAQELAAARIRAVETGRWVLQAAPTGYSAVIDHRGRVRDLSPLGPAAVLVADAGLRTGSTLTMVLGPAPWVVLASLVLLGSALLVGVQENLSVGIVGLLRRLRRKDGAT